MTGDVCLVSEHSGSRRTWPLACWLAVTAPTQSELATASAAAAARAPALARVL
jgi:hypothetical protein